MPIPLGVLAVAGAGAAGGGATFELIQTTVLTSGFNTISFTNLPQTYKHLQIRVVTKINTSGNQSFNLQLNADTGSNYRTHYLIGTGSTVFSSDAGQSTSMSIATAPGNDASNQFGAAILDILDYNNTNKNKVVRCHSGQFGDSAFRQNRLASGLWLNTAAVTGVTILTGSPDMLTGTRVSVYGIGG